MARKKQSKNVSTGKLNKLQLALQEGTPILGLTGYVPMGDRDEDSDDAVWVKVKVLGFDTKSCGVTIQVTPVSGEGTFTITPCKWKDTVDDLAHHRDQLARKELARQDKSYILSPNYIRDRKDRLTEYVNKLSEGRQKAFWNQVAEMSGSEVATTLHKIDDNEVDWLAEVITYEYHGVEEQVPKKNRYY